MEVRLVAYRKATSSSTQDSTYNLDLQESPNISLNFQFADIKEPEKRKGSFSQTFKLPFTDNNNEFFQNWYNVNLETLVFSTRTKFDAVLFVGTTPQFEGTIQLKSIYKKAELYEVILLSNTATLFSVIGDNRLKDVFLEDDGSYSGDFNHVYDNTTLSNSWNNTLQNTSGTTLTNNGITQIVYPFSVTQPGFYYPTNDRYLRMSQSDITTLGYSSASNYTVNLSQFRPAIQIRTLFERIIARSGFSYTSSFLDSDYFSKIYMTTANHIEAAALPTTNANTAPSGLMYVGNTDNWGEILIPGTTYICPDEIMPCPVNLPITTLGVPYDSDQIWNTTNHFFTKEAFDMASIEIYNYVFWNNVRNISPYTSGLWIGLQKWDNDPTSPTYNSLVDEFYGSTNVEIGNLWSDGTGNAGSYGMTNTVSLENMPVGASACVVFRLYYVERVSSAFNGVVRLGQIGTQTFTASAIINWMGYSTNVYGATVDIPSCIDPDLKQKDFLKDIIERFNLVVVTDPDNDSNLIIEPYNDYLALGSIKRWTDKLDTSKEIIIKDTTELQKKIVHLSDQEDVDLNNAVLKERYPDVNVFGHIRIQDDTNEFAKGELKNNSIFSPFINDQIYKSASQSGASLLANFTVQYEFGYESNENDGNNVVKKTKPKLFYYSGTPVSVKDAADNTTTYYLHNHNSTAEIITAYSYNEYPVCSPFDVPGTTDTYSLNADTVSLYWNSTPPLNGTNLIFNNGDTQGNWFNGSLYGKYWKSYLNEIYSDNARIMEAFVNLDAYDIFDFKFNDEIFIKDTYWRILKIQNYQVNGNASTKITFIKSLDTKENCTDCDYVLGYVGGISGGLNFIGDATTGYGAYVWCPDDDPTCSPTLTGTQISLYTQPACCDCNGGFILWNQTTYADQNLYPCMTYAGSPPAKITNKQGVLSIWKTQNLKGLLTGILGVKEKPFVIGSDNTKYSREILPYMKDDQVIKYNVKNRLMPYLEGESHKVILMGNTVGSNKNYAYPRGEKGEESLKIPPNVNIIIRVKGLATVIGGKNASYPLGSTEGIGYYTAFKVDGATPTQLGTIGGTVDFSLKEAGLLSVCSLYIDINQGVLRFGIQDSQNDTNRVWELSAEIDINRIYNIGIAHDENWALFQNGQRIQFENGDYLIWN
tara:strand:- start:16404 stop:19862 length:3459 start_codon:yes stop_codon:yes gene_type:complete